MRCVYKVHGFTAHLLCPDCFCLDLKSLIVIVLNLLLEKVETALPIKGTAYLLLQWRLERRNVKTHVLGEN